MTVDGEPAALPTAEEHDLIEALAQLALERAAPEELALFPETAEEYFRDPQAAVAPRGRDEAVGFGLDLALMTPYILAVAVPVVRYLAGIVQQSVGRELDASVSAAIKRLLRRHGDAQPSAPEVPVLTSEQLREVRSTAYARAVGLGLDESRATLLADSVVGGLALG